MLSDEELEQVTAGISRQNFGQYILSHNGGADPDLSELVDAIVSGNWPLVAIIAVQEVGTGNKLVVSAFTAC